MSTIRGLIRLIKASSGTEGVATNSFRNNVTASANGVGMADYKIGGVSWTAYPSAPPYTYSDGASLSLTATLSEFGSKATTILNSSTSAWATTFTNYDGNGTGTVTLNSVTWSTNSPTLNMTLHGAVTPGTTPAATISNLWYTTGGAYPNTPWGTTCTSPTVCNCSGTECTDGYSVTITLDPGTIAASGTSSMYLNVTFHPDHYDAGFNPLYDNSAVISSFITSVNRIANTVSLDVYWYDDAGMTSLVGTGYTYSFTSYQTTDIYIYYKYRKSGSSESFQTGYVHWVDPRPDA